MTKLIETAAKALPELNRRIIEAVMNHSGPLSMVELALLLELTPDDLPVLLAQTGWMLLDVTKDDPDAEVWIEDNLAVLSPVEADDAGALGLIFLVNDLIESEEFTDYEREIVRAFLEAAVRSQDGKVNLTNLAEEIFPGDANGQSKLWRMVHGKLGEKLRRLAWKHKDLIEFLPIQHAKYSGVGPPPKPARKKRKRRRVIKKRDQCAGSPKEPQCS